MCLHSTQEWARPSPCFGFYQCSSRGGLRGAMERQLQAVNPFEIEEFHGLKKMKNKTPNPPKITHLICISSRHGVLERSPAVDDVMGTSMGSVGTGRDSWAAAEGPEDPSALGPFPQEPLGSHYPGGAHGDTGGQHEAGPAPRALGWQLLVQPYKTPRPPGAFPFSSGKELRKGRWGGTGRTQVPHPILLPETGSAPREPSRARPGLGIWHKLPTPGTAAS